ncbi:MAG: hypothetical protein NTU53_24415 [Planctomycetota bacterium]|nr:hypothetical protein [Planctomycetota bacterium]
MCRKNGSLRRLFQESVRFLDELVNSLIGAGGGRVGILRGFDTLEGRVMLDGSDLIVESVSTSVSAAVLGQSINVTFTIKNQGNMTATPPSPEWVSATDSIYLSEDNVFDEMADKHLASQDGIWLLGDPTELAAGASYTRTDVPVTLSGVSAGRRYLFVVTDQWAYVSETDETNNVSAPVALDLTAPNIDLRVINPTVSRTNVKCNETIDLSWGVQNFGTENATAPEWTDAAWLSSDATLNTPSHGPGGFQPGDTMLTDGWHYDGLAAGASYTQPATGVMTAGIPNVTPGTWYVLFSVDRAMEWGNNSQVESDESNNVVAVPITIAAPSVDLQISNPSAPATGSGGDAINVSWRVTNAGSDAANGAYSRYSGTSMWYDAVYMSDTATFDKLTATVLGPRRQSTPPLAGGASYDATATVTIPEGTALGSKYLFIVPDDYSEQSETNETNNISAAIPFTVVPPQVDLVISTASVTNPPVRPATIAIVSWTVLNQGTSTARGGWYDRFFLSADSTLDVQDVSLNGETFHSSSSPLAGGASYSQTSWVGIPYGTVGGSWHLLVVTDYSAGQVETNEDNNVYDVPIQVVQPDLVVQSISAPAVGTPGQAIWVSWVARNDGTATAGGVIWDYVYLSTDTTLSGDDTYLNNDVLSRSAAAGGGTYSAGATVTLPTNLPSGPYYLLVQLDHGNGVGESNESNNVGSLAIQLGVPPDLTVTAAAGPAQADWGQSVNFTWTVSNVGEGSASLGWTDRVYLSNSNTLDGSAVYVGSLAHSEALGAGAQYDAAASFVIPVSVGVGQKYILIQTDFGGTQGESNENNNVIVAAGQMTVRAPDLTVLTATAPAAAVLGETISVSWTVKNVGPGSATRDWYDQVFISSDQTLDAGDVVVLSESISSQLPVAADGTYTITREFVIPATVGAGSRYVLFAVDALSNQSESDETNNVRSAAITISAPNLVVSSPSAPASAIVSQTVHLAWTVTNQSAVPAPADWHDAVFLSTDATLSGDDVRITLQWIGTQTPLAAGAHYDMAVDVPVPQVPAGHYYVIFVIDRHNQQGESDETDNTAIAQMDVTSPDLSVIGLEAPTTAALGDSMSVTWTVENIGGAAAIADWYDNLYLSNDQTFSGDDTHVSTLLIADQTPLAGGAQYTATQTVTIPRTGTGDRYLLLVIDGSYMQGESNETNNVAAVPITLTSPQLTVTSATAPAQASLSETISVSWTVGNSGNGVAAADLYDTIYLSRSNVLDGSAVFVGYQSITDQSPLAAGGTYTVSRTITIPQVGTGAWYLLFAADGYDYQPESNETDNTRAVAINLSAADLTVTAVDAPAQISVGQRVDIGWTVSNADSGPATGSWYDAIYLSTDATLGGDDRWLGAESAAAKSPLAAGATYTLSSRVNIPAVAAGQYYILVLTDAYDGQGESDSTNNVRAIPVTVSSPDLVISSVNAPASASASWPFHVTWTVRNQGQGPAEGDWYDAVYFSTDQQLDDTDALLRADWTGVMTPLAASATYTFGGDITMSSQMRGQGYLLFVADRYGYQPETDDTNNVYASAITLSAADLQVSAATAPASANLGQTIDIAYTIRNAGGGAARSGRYDRVYLSDNATLDAGDTILLTRWVSPETLESGASVDYTGQVVIPAAAAGNKYLLFVADAQDSQGETDETNNVLEKAITLSAADLTIAATAPASVRLGENFNVSWTVTNSGAGAAPAGWYDYVYLSTDAVLDAGDRALVAQAKDGATALAVGDHYQVSKSMTLWGSNTQPGNYYLLFVADASGNQPEGNETNNVFASALAVVAPNLVIQDPVAPSDAVAGAGITVNWTTRNSGNASVVSPWTERAVISTDQYFGNWDDVLIGTVSGATDLAADATIARSVTGTMPWGYQGAYTLFIKVDMGGTSAESNENDNLYTAAIQISYATPPADLIVDAMTVPGLAGTGAAVQVAWRVTNQGTAATRGSAWSDRVYLSSDSVFGSDWLLGTFSHSGALASGDNYTQVQNLVLPVDLAAGQYWVFVATDVYGQLDEPGAEGNNVARSLGAMDVSLSPVPDLLPSAVSGPAAANTGQPVTISYTVRNAGRAIAAGPWKERVYLSPDGTLNGAAHLATFNRTDSLAAGQSAARTETVTLPVWADGNYRLVVVVDSDNQVFERDDEGNNTTASTAALVVQHPDLVVTTASTTNAAQSGTGLTVTWTARNAGTGTAPGDWLDRVYLSTDATLSGDDLLRAEVTRPDDLTASGTYNAQAIITLPNGISGTYYIIVKTDAADGVEEATFDDNNATPTAAVAVSLAPYADLAISAVMAQSQLIGDPVDLTVSWTVTNAGTGAGPISSWTDRVVLSRDGTLGNGDDLVLGNFTRSGAMPVATSYTQTQIITLPAALVGRFTLFVKTDAADVVYEHTDTNSNVGSPAHFVDVMPVPCADLVVEAVAAPTAGRSAEPISLTWTIHNQGIGATSTAQWNDVVWISDNPTGATNARTLGSFSHVGSLGVDGRYTRSAQVTLPSDIGGNWYVFVSTGGPFEFIYTDNNTTRSDAVAVTLVPPPPVDLEVTAVSGPASINDGATVDVSWTVKNRGPQSISSQASWTDVVYIGPNGDFAHAQEIGRFTYSGGLEAGKTYTRTERFHMAEHIQGVYQFFIRTDATAQVPETNENNNVLGATDGTVVALTARPDLQVTSLLAPDSVTSGGVIDLEWTVVNRGSVRTPTGGSRWTDDVYLSLNNVLDGGDRLLGSVANGAALAATESYTSQARFNIPAGFGGNFYVIVKADGGDVVDEYPQEGNNTVARPLAIDVTVVPPPDLVVGDVNTATEAFDSSTITVHYKVTNRGAGVTYPGWWSDTVWLTRAKDRPNIYRGDVYLGTFAHDGVLDVNGFYTNDVQVTLPKHISGQYYITAWADSSDRVYEQPFDINLNPDAPTDPEGSNFKARPLTVLYTPPADLEVMQVTAPATAKGGRQVTLSWTVANNGQSATDRDQWADAIYVSTDATLHDGQGQEWMVFGLPHYGKMASGQSYTQTATFTLPPAAEGAYLVVETNVDPTVLMTDEELLLHEVGDILNRAETATADRDLTDLSRRELLDILIGPGPERVFEGPWTTNNAKAAACAVTGLRPDLQVSDIRTSVPAYSGDPVQVSWTVTNVGDDAVWSGTQRWTDRVYVSPDPVFSLGRATLIGAVVHSNATPLGSAASYTASVTMNLPEGIEGRKYVHVFSDRDPQKEYGGLDEVPAEAYPNWPETYRARVWEAGKKVNNYASAAVSVIYREADLQVTTLTVASTAASSATLPVSWTVKNQGTRATRVNRWMDRVYISTDPSLDLYDELLATSWRQGDGPLEPDASYTGNAEVRLPDGIQGNFYLLVFTDSPFGETWQASIDYTLPYPTPSGAERLEMQGGGNGMALVHEFAQENNNVLVSALTVTLANTPDLRVTDVAAPVHATVGKGFELTYQVTNLGQGLVPDRQNQWTDYIYLSRDKYLDVRSDPYVGSVTHTGALAVNQSYTVTQTWGLPRGVLGDYYVYVLTDVPNSIRPQGYVYEGSGETNNARSSAAPVIIELPPPGDLQVDSVQVPTSAVVGDAMTVEWTVSNHHATESIQGVWADSVYLSADATWDLGDKLVGRIEQGTLRNPKTLTPGASYTAKLNTLLPPALPGGYRLIVRSDIFDDIYEGANNANNSRASAGTMNVDVKTMYLGVPVSDELSTGQELLYRLDVGAGETLQINLDSQNDHAANELYARFEGLPSSIFYDAIYEGHLWADQTARVPTTRAGTYYILVRGTSEPQPNTPVQLVARALPFGISDVTPEVGGDSRYVTLQITGAKFSEQAVVKLVRPEFAEYEPVNYQVTSAAQIKAVFDLRAAPHGLYDVQVINPDGSIATLPYRYLVESARPLDLTVGAGGPTKLGLGEVGWYGLGIYSLSNVDAPYVHVEMSVPNVRNPREDLIPGPALVFRTNLYGDPNLANVPWASVDPIANLGGKQVAGGFTFDFINRGYAALTFTADAYPELRELLKQDKDWIKNNLSDLDQEDLAFAFYIAASATPMTAQEYIDYQLARAGELRTRILADATAPSALIVAAADSVVWGQAYLASLTDAGLLRPEDEPPAIRSQPQFVSLMQSLDAGLLGMPAGQGIIAAGNLTAFFEKVRQWYGHDPSQYAISDVPPNAADYDLGLANKTHFETFRVQVGAEPDPDILAVAGADLSGYFGAAGRAANNVKMIGPQGTGPESFVPLNAPLPGRSTSATSASAISASTFPKAAAPSTAISISCRRWAWFCG